MKRIAVYKRVSTDKQDTDMQQHAIAQWLGTQPAAEVTYYEDVGISGSTSARPEFQRLKDDVEAGKVDAVVVYRLDRLSRNATDAILLLTQWIKDDIEFVAVDQAILRLDKSNPLRHTFLALFSEIAQLERETIVRRINDGLSAARARGVKLGRKKKLTPTQVQQAVALRSTGYTLEQLATTYGISIGAMFNALKHTEV